MPLEDGGSVFADEAAKAVQRSGDAGVGESHQPQQGQGQGQGEKRLWGSPISSSRGSSPALRMMMSAVDEVTSQASLGGQGLKGLTVDGLEEEAMMLYQAERARARLREAPLSRGFSHSMPLPDNKILSEILTRSLDPFVMQDVFLPKTHYGTSRAARLAARAARPPRTVGEAIAMQMNPLDSARPDPLEVLNAAKDGIEAVQRGGSIVQWHPLAKLNNEMKELTRGAFATSGPLSRPYTTRASSAMTGAQSTSQTQPVWVPSGGGSKPSLSPRPGGLTGRRRRPSTVGFRGGDRGDVDSRKENGGWDVSPRRGTSALGSSRVPRELAPRAARTARDFTPDEYFPDANRLIDVEREREADLAQVQAQAREERKRAKEAREKERLLRELAEFNSARDAMIQAKKEEAAVAREAEKRRQKALARELKQRGAEQVRQYKEKRDVLMSNALLVQTSTRSHFGRANFDEINAARGPITKEASSLRRPHRIASAK